MQSLRIALLASLLTIGFTGVCRATGPVEMKPLSTEYGRAQMVDWIDSETFVVGRWDGSLSVFRIPKGEDWTPTLLQVLVTSAGAGVELVAALDTSTVLFSNSDRELALWTRDGTGKFGEPILASYDVIYGTANSATNFKYQGDDLVVTGHANGFALIWNRNGTVITLARVIDLKSSQPLPSPYPLKNIRGLAKWKDDLVVSGSEDGDLVIFSAVTGIELTRQRYSPSAERGINNISAVGNFLLVVNCSVGKSDKNLWLYSMSETGIALESSLNLARDVTRSQVFNFDGDLFEADGRLRFVSSTEEGLMWRGYVNGRTLEVDAVATVVESGGASLDVNVAIDRVVAAAHNIMLFEARR